MRNCKQCIWYDKCTPEVGGCEYYVPINKDEEEAQHVKEYKRALRENQADYQEIVDEMSDNSGGNRY